jgi:hypothetical protein
MMELKKERLETPVVLLIFNRPEHVHKLFDVVREVKPVRLFIIGDGPRAGRHGEKEKCDASRSIVHKVDWDCEVLTNFSDTNLGCRNRVSSGLTWVFQKVEQAIVLEDDCLPHITFFKFCEELLDRFKEDQRIMAISGNNFQFGRKRTEYSYYFSRYNHCWGWASWKRAWQHYDNEMKLWPYIRDHDWMKDIFEKKSDRVAWENYFQDVYNEKVNSWAFRWTFACWMQSGLTVLPSVNLVSNNGFDHSGTHTRERKNPLASLPVEAMGFTLKHPPFVIRDTIADEFTQNQNFTSSVFYRVYQKMKKLFGN